MSQTISLKQLLVLSLNIPYLQATDRVTLWDEVVRYTHPNHIFNVVLTRPSGAELADRAFLYHARLSSSDIFNGPGLSTWLRARVLLRSMTADVANVACYKSDVGLRVTGDGVAARYVVLERDGRHLVVVNTTNPKHVPNATLVLRRIGAPAIRHAVAYTMEGRVRRIDLKQAGPEVRLTVPKERLVSILLCAEERVDRRVRLFAMVPFLEPGPTKVRVAVANLSDQVMAGALHLDQPGPLRVATNDVPVKLTPGGATVLDVVVRHRDQLHDFTDLDVTCRTNVGTRTTRVIVPPTVPNGDFEDDVMGNALPDYWTSGLRDFAQPHSGKYCLLVVPKGVTWHRGMQGPATSSPYWHAVAYAFLLPETRYRLTFHLRYTGTHPVACIVRTFDHVNKVTFERRWHYKGEPPLGWRLKTVEFTTPATAYKANVTFANQDETGKGVNAWVDTVHVTELGPSRQ